MGEVDGESDGTTLNQTGACAGLWKDVLWADGCGGLEGNENWTRRSRDMSAATEDILPELGYLISKNGNDISILPFAELCNVKLVMLCQVTQ